MREADKRMYYIVSPNSFAYNPARINVGSIGYQNIGKNVIVSSLYEVFKTSEDVDDRLLWHWFKSPDFQKLIMQLQEGGVRLYFYYDKLCMGEVSLPSLEEQRKIGKLFDTLDNLITHHQREQNYKKDALMSYTLTKYEKETVLLYNQSHDPITISTYDPGLRRRLREFAARYPELCRRVDKQKYPDYAEYEIQKERVSIRLLPPMSEEKRRVASEKAKAAGLGTKGNA